jgi:hypothetical protein
MNSKACRIECCGKRERSYTGRENDTEGEVDVNAADTNEDVSVHGYNRQLFSVESPGGL